MISFVICGAQKSGTSALHEYLIEHPQISLSRTKELHLFDDEKRDWSKEGIRRIDDEIRNYFDAEDIKKKRGEATPSSMWWKPAMRRIWEYNADMRLIAILRNPVTRAYANWRMETYKGRETELLQLTMEEEEERCRNALPYQHRIHSYISRGFYCEQIRRIWHYFPRKSLKIIKQESLLNHPEQTLKEVYRHLEIREVEFKGKKEINSWNSTQIIKENRRMKKDISKDPEERIVIALKKIYRKEIMMLEDMTNMDCSDWL